MKRYVTRDNKAQKAIFSIKVTVKVSVLVIWKSFISEVYMQNMKPGVSISCCSKLTVKIETNKQGNGNMSPITQGGGGHEYIIFIKGALIFLLSTLNLHISMDI